MSSSLQYASSLDSPPRTADVSTDKSDSPASWTSQHAASTLHALASAGNPSLSLTNNTLAASSAPPTAAVKAAPKPRAPKKKSSTSNATTSSGVQASSSKASEVGNVARRRKANRACSACQKAHLTCDDSRPCQRCFKKGLQATCTDGTRKKAKYLLDETEIAQMKREKESKVVKAEGSTEAEEIGSLSALQARKELDEAGRDWRESSASFDTAAPLFGPSGPDLSQAGGAPEFFGLSAFSPPATTDSPFHGDSTYGGGAGSDGAYAGHDGAFGAEAASLEYSILSSMLHGIDPHLLRATPDTDSGASGAPNPRPPRVGALPHLHMGSGSAGAWRWEGETQLQGVAAAAAAAADDTWDPQAQLPQQQHAPQPHPLQQAHTNHQQAGPGTSYATNNSNNNGESVPALHAMSETIGPDGESYGALEVPSPNGSSAAAPLQPGTLAPAPVVTPNGDVELPSGGTALAPKAPPGQADREWRERVKHVYSDSCRPFPYTEGYHFLIKHVTANFEKAEVLRIVRALAIFRPSLIALQMPLTEDDEIFVERSIQRTVLELEKLISFSGTPTVVWRRTCEICVVGMEFCMLTQRTRESLLGKRIYEFFDKESTLDYWEKFALHAFENTAQTINMSCNLISSSGTVVKCAACFSIKRDVFDLPSMVIMNFLPILS